MLSALRPLLPNIVQEGEPQTAPATAGAVAAATAAAAATTPAAAVAARSTRDRTVEFKMLYQMEDEHTAVKIDNSDSRRGARVSLGLHVIRLRVSLLIQMARTKFFFSFEEGTGRERAGCGGKLTAHPSKFLRLIETRST